MADPKRFRITVPAEDESVLRWVAAQQSLSYSVRMLIREYIQREGYTDVTCAEVTQLPRRGRPSKQLVETFAETAAAMEEDAAAPEAAVDDDGFLDPEAFLGH